MHKIIRALKIFLLSRQQNKMPHQHDQKYNTDSREPFTKLKRTVI